MNYPERLPIAKEGGQFPYGDIDTVHRTAMVDQWLDSVKGYNPPRWLNYMMYTSRTTSTDNRPVHNNFTSGLRLCNAWDTNANVTDKYAVLGYISSRAFTLDTKLLPQWTTDISDEIQQMQREQQDAITFGRVAINGMYASYPVLAKQYGKLYDHVVNLFTISDDREKGYLQAGIALPYMMTTADQFKSAMANKKINGVIIGSSQQLEAMDFGDIFSVDPEQAN